MAEEGTGNKVVNGVTGVFNTVRKAATPTLAITAAFTLVAIATGGATLPATAVANGTLGFGEFVQLPAEGLQDVAGWIGDGANALSTALS